MGKTYRREKSDIASKRKSSKGVKKNKYRIQLTEDVWEDGNILDTIDRSNYDELDQFDDSDDIH